MVRPDTVSDIEKLADELGKNSAAGLLAEVAEVLPRIKPQNFHKALAEFIDKGSK